MLVRAVDIVGQVATDRLANLARFEVRHDLVVDLSADCVAGFACADPSANVVPHAIGVLQYRGGSVAHCVGVVALLAEPFERAEMLYERLPVEDPREVSRVVYGIEAVAIGQQVAFERRQGGLQLAHRDLGHVHLGHKEAGRFVPWV